MNNEKRMLLLKNPDSEFFSEAYFILKEQKCHVSDSEIVREANRIVGQSIISGYFTGGRKRGTGKLGFFVLGLALGALAMVMLR